MRSSLPLPRTTTGLRSSLARGHPTLHALQAALVFVYVLAILLP
ncbi:hypothetical protein [Lentzea atacamensis]|nr:hypothetical protein [Lentzea atacamensis]